MDYRKHLQAFIDRWRYNANRGKIWSHSLSSIPLMLFSAAQAQMKIKILEKVKNSTVLIRAAHRCEHLVTWSTTSWTRGDRAIQVCVDSITLSHFLTWNKGSLRPKRSHLRYCKCQKWRSVIHPTSWSWKTSISMLAWIQGSQWLGRMVPESQQCMSIECIPNRLTDHHNRIKILTGELNPISGHVTRNGRLRMFVNHYCHVDRWLSQIIEISKWIFRSTSRWLLKSHDDASAILGV
jgi:hypothetical protein